jgi:hypothetical protein
MRKPVARVGDSDPSSRKIRCLGQEPYLPVLKGCEDRSWFFFGAAKGSEERRALDFAWPDGHCSRRPDEASWPQG